MAHFAKINENNMVEAVIVIADEHEAKGQDFINKVLKLSGTWIQTSYNHKIRGKFAGIGDVYDFENDLFIQPILETDETLA